MQLPLFEESKSLDDLTRAMAANRLLALVGAGASVASGYPSWPDLMTMMNEILSRDDKIPPKYAAILRSIDDPAWQAEEMYVRMSPEEFATFISGKFQEPRTPHALSEPHLRIAGLGFRHIITTNYDPCIELAMRRAGRPFTPIHWSDAADVRTFFRALSDRSAPPCIVYLHGRFDRPADIVLTETSYARLYLNDVFQRRIVAVFMTQPVVFLGFSMRDPDLGQIMRSVRANLGVEDSQHFGVFGYRTEDERALIERRMRDKFGLRAVFYRIQSAPGDAEDHSGLLALLDRIGAGGLASAAGAPTAPAAAPELHVAKEPADEVDPNKGLFGGTAETARRRLLVRDVRLDQDEGFAAFTLVVESRPGAGPPLAGPVRFHLHPTFPREQVVVPARNGTAELPIDFAYGAFTVGAVVENDPPDENRLELDLSAATEFPAWFRER